MIDKLELRARAFIARALKNGIEQDIEESNMYFQEYLFRKLIFRTIYLFLLCFVVFSVLNLKDVFFIQSMLSKELFLNKLTISIIYSFFICAIYGVVTAFAFKKEYDLKIIRTLKYNRAIDSLEKNDNKTNK